MNRSVFKFIIFVCFFISGCEAKNKNVNMENYNISKKSYVSEKNDNYGKIINISVEEFLKKVESGEDFSFVITQEECCLCDKLKDIINSTDSIKITYKIILDKSSINYKSDVKKLKALLPKLIVTPDIRIKQGKKILSYDEEYDELSRDNLLKWLDKYNIN